jgi:uncharacterized protein (TIGR02246 family)
MTNDENIIRRLIGTWMEATKQGDIPKVLGLIAEDAVFMVPGRKPFGKETFAATLREMIDTRIDGSSKVEEIEIFGDWAFCRNHLTMTVTPPNGKPVRREGYTLTIFRKEPSGKWVLTRDANLLTTV